MLFGKGYFENKRPLPNGKGLATTIMLSIKPELCTRNDDFIVKLLPFWFIHFSLFIL